MKKYIPKANYDYKGYRVQEADDVIFVRDPKGKIVGKFPTFEEATEFIDEETAK